MKCIQALANIIGCLLISLFILSGLLFAVLHMGLAATSILRHFFK